MIPRPRWGIPLVLGVIVGLRLNAATVPASPGQWEASPRHAVAAESAWILRYLSLRPRVGDRISTGFFVALAEGENAWAQAYLDRQHEALNRAAERIPSDDLATRRLVASVQALLAHDRSMVVAAGDQAVDPFAQVTLDQGAGVLRARTRTRLGAIADLQSGQHSAQFRSGSTRRLSFGLIRRGGACDGVSRRVSPEYRNPRRG